MPERKPKNRKLHSTGTTPKAATPERDVSNAELQASIKDLIYEMQQLNSNLGKLYAKLENVERTIPDDDVPF